MTNGPARKTPGELLRERGQHAGDIVAVRTGGRLVDLHTPIDANAELVPVHASEPAGIQVLRHSAAHVMADAVQRLFPGTQVTIAPAIDSGFYYDFSRPDAQPFNDAGDLGAMPLAAFAARLATEAVPPSPRQERGILSNQSPTNSLASR